MTTKISEDSPCAAKAWKHRRIMREAAMLQDLVMQKSSATDWYRETKCG